MIEAEFALAFTLGMVVAVNPCGFAMLPAYLAYFLGLEGAESGTTGSMGRALTVAGTLTAGFVLVFGVIGLVMTHLGLTLWQRHLPWVTMIIGVALVGLGLAMALRGFQLNVRLPKVKTGRIGNDLVSMFVFGVSYAVASLSCALPLFLPVMTRAFRSANLISGISVFLAFTAGMAVLLGGITLALAGARTALVNRLRSAMPTINRVAGVLVALAGVYLAYYGWWERAVLSGDPSSRPADGPVTFVQNISYSIGDWINSVGAVRIAIVVATLAAIAALLVVGLRKPTPPQPKETVSTP